MSGKFQPIKRDTAYLLPPTVQDWLPENHLARFVMYIVDQLDLSELVKRYGSGGKEPCHPALLLALLFYGYATGIFYSRKLEQATMTLLPCAISQQTSIRSRHDRHLPQASSTSAGKPVCAGTDGCRGDGCVKECMYLGRLRE
jgi:hypothetical protein